ETGFSSGDLRTRLDSLPVPEGTVAPLLTDIESREKKAAPSEAPSPGAQQPEETAEESAPDIDPELLAIFLEEAAELLDSISVELQGWRDGKAEALGRLRRALHTLKGSARMTGAMALGDLGHDM